MARHHEKQDTGNTAHWYTKTKGVAVPVDSGTSDHVVDDGSLFM